ncbi:MAG: hypothetical protein FWG90_06180 [Oscillospiraceae bacterium]|nr:hypothetical protein [Oscillospiraceae bacterium]
MSKIFYDEHGRYQINLNAAKYAVGDLHEKYKTIGNFLSDVDWIAETDTEIFLIEYKNSAVQGIAEDEGFRAKLKGDNYRIFLDSLKKKFYGSTYYLYSCQKCKPLTYIVILEARFLKHNDNLRKRILASIKKHLPFGLQELKLPEIKDNLINDVKVLSIQEWNEQYPMFPLEEVKKELILEHV